MESVRRAWTDAALLLFLAEFKQRKERDEKKRKKPCKQFAAADGAG